MLKLKQNKNPVNCLYALRMLHQHNLKEFQSNAPTLTAQYIMESSGDARTTMSPSVQVLTTVDAGKLSRHLNSPLKGKSVMVEICN